MEVQPTLHLHSVMLGVRDIEQSLVFYRDLLGFTLSGRFGDIALLEGAGFRLTLRTLAPGGGRRDERLPVEIVLAVDGVRNAYDRLRAGGVVFLNAPHTIDGTNDVANFEDPDRHLFSLYEPP